MRYFINFVSAWALAFGLAIAFYSWQEPYILQVTTGQRTEQVFQSTRQAGVYLMRYQGVEERQLGLEFGMGLAFLGAFGLYAQGRERERARDARGLGGVGDG